MSAMSSDRSVQLVENVTPIADPAPLGLVLHEHEPIRAVAGQGGVDHVETPVVKQPGG